MASRAFVTGWPLEHTRSPMIHTAWLQMFGLDGTYDAVPVPPDEAAAFLKRCDANGYRGGNVTIPHKEVALASAMPDETALAIGAANTVWVDSGQLRCTNTDAYGFLANLDERAPGWNDKREVAIVLGAGGAARAIVFALLGRGYEIVHVLNRTRSRAQSLRDLGHQVHAGGLEGMQGLLPLCDLLVNTTSQGMSGEDAGDWPPDLSGLPPHAVVTDIVYTPLRTSLLDAAEARGLTAVDGLGMLLHQAVPGFEMWFGRKPTVTARLRRRVVQDLGEREPVFLGLTGSIGMGKSTTAAMFAEAGVPVYDADAAVHVLYSGAAVEPIEAAFPGTTKNGTVDRTVLSERVVGQPDSMRRLEEIVHPLVALEQAKFRHRVAREGHEVAVLDIPLLFETGGDVRADAVVCVTAPEEVQRERVLARGTMTSDRFEAILERQMPDAEKRRRSDFVIDTSEGLEPARDRVAEILSTVRDRDWMPVLTTG